MTIWIVKSQTDDPNRALEILKDHRERGYKVWIEDKYGGKVDEEALKKNDIEQANSRRYQMLMAFLIWGIAAVVGIGGLYVLGLWVDHDL